MATATEILTEGTKPAEAPNPSATSNGPDAPAVPAPASGWWDSVKDPELKGFLANKAYDSPETLGKAYRSLEQLFGADKAGRTAVMPKDDNDAEGRKAFFAKIGVPETAEGYKLPLPQGDDGTFAKWAATAFHKAGIPAKAAELMATEWNAWVGRQVEESGAADKAAGERELEGLRVEWAHEYDAKEQLARNGLREVGTQAGLVDADLAKLETAIGTAKMLKLFVKLGEAAAESKFAGGGSGTSAFGITPTKARERIDELTAKRTSGEINDIQWRNEAEPEIVKLSELAFRKAG